MCMYLKKGDESAKIANRDIVCYKMLKVIDDGRMITPYQKMPCEIGAEYTSKLRKNVGKKSVTFGLHTYTSKAAAFMQYRALTCFGQFVVCKCIIPKGSSYFVGEFLGLSGTLRSYASNRLRIVEEVHMS